LNKKIISAVAVVALGVAGTAVGLLADGDHGDSRHFEFKEDSLVLSRSVYEGTAETVTIGETLPRGCAGGANGSTVVAVPLTAGGTTNVTVTCGVASDNGEAPNLLDSHNVWNNSGSDGSFGVSSPIFLDNLTTDGERLGTLRIPSDQIVTSFSSKSELSLNRSIDGKSITFMGYQGGPGCRGFPVSPTAPNLVDVSASNTPGICDPTNSVISSFVRLPLFPRRTTGRSRKWMEMDTLVSLLGTRTAEITGERPSRAGMACTTW
jgi:hypothetical protein